MDSSRPKSTFLAKEFLYHRYIINTFTPTLMEELDTLVEDSRPEVNEVAEMMDDDLTRAIREEITKLRRWSYEHDKNLYYLLKELIDGYLVFDSSATYTKEAEEELEDLFRAIDELGYSLQVERIRAEFYTEGDAVVFKFHPPKVGFIRTKEVELE